jgi:hypothetical protein
MADLKEAEGKHKDPSSSWLIFFFVCFALVLLGIVFFFARDINSETPSKPSAGEHGSMLFPEQYGQFHLPPLA